MEIHVDFPNPASLKEAICLATQFRSFDLEEGHYPVTARGKTDPPAQAGEQPENKIHTGTNEE